MSSVGKSTLVVQHIFIFGVRHSGFASLSWSTDCSFGLYYKKDLAAIQEAEQLKMCHTVSFLASISCYGKFLSYWQHVLALLFPLCSIAAMKLTFEESTNNRQNRKWHTFVSLPSKFQLLNLDPNGSDCLIENCKSRTRSSRSPWINKWFSFLLGSKFGSWISSSVWLHDHEELIVLHKINLDIL